MTQSLVRLLEHYGYYIVIVFFIAEGVGIPFPAETMLVTAAAFASRGKLSLSGVLVAGALGGIVGGSAGYWIGRLGGLPLINRLGRFIRLNQAKLARSQEFFRERGAAAAILGRFVAFLRIIVPMLIGLSTMRFARFSAFNAVGSIGAALTYGLLGYAFGRDVAALMHHLALTSVIGIVATAAAGAFYLWRRHKGLHHAA